MTAANDNVDVKKMGQAIKVVWGTTLGNVFKATGSAIWHVVGGGKAK